MLLAFVDTELVSAGRSAAASCALALATAGGSANELSSSLKTASASTAFFFSEALSSEVLFSEVLFSEVLAFPAFEATFTGLRCDDACFRYFLVNLFSATG